MTKNIFQKYLKKSDPNKAHAKYSASGSERWLGCPGSVKLSEGIPSVENQASIRGTNTHTLLQFILENENWADLLKTVDGVKFRVAIDYDTKMLNGALFAAKYVWKEKSRLENIYGQSVKLFVEQKLEFKGVGFGTSDVILYHPFGLLHVMDYKNGTKAVEPEGLTQGLYYAHAAADLFNWEFSDLHITIIQPNAVHKRGHVRTWQTNFKTLEQAGLKFLRGVKAAERDDAPLVKNDSWCWFCPARQKCPAHQEVRTQKFMDRFNQWDGSEHG